jgi:hypothetical protein
MHMQRLAPRYTLQVLAQVLGCLRLLFRRMKNEEFLWFFVVEQKNEYEVFAVVTFRVLKN